MLYVSQTMLYEIFYLVGASKESELENIKNELEKIITENGGVFQEKETFEKRRMSYEVKHETHGIYVARRFDLENGESIKEIIKKINLNPSILRFIMSRADELPELKSKEERMQEGSQKENVRETREKKESLKTVKKKEEKIIEEKQEEKTKEEEPVKSDEKKPENKEEEKDLEKDLDKKLEEILNI
jgi:ribosomal protein S6